MKKSIKLISFLLAAVFSFSLCSCGNKKETGSDDAAPKTGMSESDGIFDTSYVHKIEVTLSDGDWADLKANPLNKTKYQADVVIDGDTVKNVSFATKGNTSLSMVASSESDRYSFKINFGKFEKGQKYKGIDKLNLNNIMSDATYMKDYISYMIFREAGVKAPLVSYTRLYINGTLHGLYIAVENVSDYFLKSNYGDDGGALYKPEAKQIANIGQNGQGGFMPGGDMTMPDMPADGSMPDMSRMPGEGGTMPDMPAYGSMPDMSQMPGSNGTMPDKPADGSMPDMPQMPGGGGFAGMTGDTDNHGTDLKYKDDDPDSYEAIFANAENDVTDEDKKELIAALRSLADGENVEEHWDVEQVIRYFAAHNFVLNYDSYTGNMLHNYYLYERDGKVTILPWDYNLAFCGFMGGTDSTSAVNTPIDAPLKDVSEDQRPLWKMISSNEEYQKKYHECYDELLKSFFENGKCADEIKRIYALIREYVKDDPTAFYTIDEFDAAYETLLKFVSYRAESIRRQINGELGTTSDTQKKEDMVDASEIDVTKMGTQGGENGKGGMPGGRPGARPGPGGR